MVGHLPTRAVMKKWKQRVHARCPHCQHEHEDILHMTTCQSQPVQDFWTTSLTSLQNWMIKNNTEPDLQSFLLEGLKSWISDPQGDEISLHHFHPDNQPTFQLQLNLGWYTLITGLIHPSLATLQQTHYSKLSKRTTGASWAAQFIQQLWHHLYELWLLRN